MVGGVYRLATGIATTAAQTIGAVVPAVVDTAPDQPSQVDIAWNDIKQQARKLLRQTDKAALQPEAIEQKIEGAVSSARNTAQDIAQSPTAAEAEFESLLHKLIRKGKTVTSEADRKAVINVLTARGMSQEEAAKTVDSWQEAYAQAVAKAEQLKAEAAKKARAIADQTADAMSTAALWAFSALLLGAIAAAMGGAAGRPRTALTQSL